MEKGCTHFEGGSAGSPVRFVRNAQSVDAATLRQLVQPGRVHSAVYTSPDIFEAEIERIFHGSWLYVGHASEVPQKVTTGYGALDASRSSWCAVMTMSCVS